MNISKKKVEELKDRESRQFFYEEHIESGLPIQIRELRKKRELTQKGLAQLAECDQSNISDWENPNYEYTPQISTLKRLANAFDVPLIVRFGSWKELFEWENNLTNEKLAPLTFDEEFSNDEEQEVTDDKEQENADYRKNRVSNLYHFPKITLPANVSIGSSSQPVQPKLWLEEVNPNSSASLQNKPISDKSIAQNGSSTFKVGLKKTA